MGKNLNSGKAREVAIGKQEADVCTIHCNTHTNAEGKIIRYTCMQKKENGDIRGSVNNNHMWGERSSF